MVILRIVLFLIGAYLLSGCHGPADKAGHHSSSRSGTTSWADKFAHVSPEEIDSELSVDDLEKMTKALAEIRSETRVDLKKIRQGSDSELVDDIGNKEAFKHYLEGKMLLRGAPCP